MLVRNLGIESDDKWLLAVLLTIAVVVFAAWLAVKLDCLPIAVGITGFGACLVSPFTWYHHWVWIVPIAVSVFVAANQAAAHFTRGNAARWQFAGLLSVGALVLVCLPFVGISVAANLLWEFNPERGFSWMYVPAALAFLAIFITYALVEKARRNRARTRRWAELQRAELGVA